MTKPPQWKRTQAGNPMFSFWNLRVVVFKQRNGQWSYNTLGLPDGTTWGPKFATEAAARTAAATAFLEAKAAYDWTTPGKAAFRESLRDGSRDRWLKEQERRDDADVEALGRGEVEDDDYADILEHGGDR
jgi:hypothetical protein